MSENISRRAAVKLTLFVMVVTLAVAVPAAVWASHQFNDVPTNHPFHNEISTIADAGIAAGFEDGGFHPSANVTRQAMAAFMERGLGRVGSNTTTELISLIPNAFTSLAGTFLDPGATADGSGYALLMGTAWFRTTAPAECPCRVTLHLVDLLDPGDSLETIDFDIPGTVSTGGTAAATGTIHAVVSVPADTTQQFVLTAFLTDATTTVAGEARLSAVYIPIGPDGDETLAYCSAGETEPNGSIAQATPIAGEVLGCIEPTGDLDFFSINVAAADKMIRASTTGLAGTGTCDMDTFVRITTSVNGLLDDDDNGGPGACSLAVTGTVVPGTYYVRVNGATSAIGSYRLVVELLDS